ncbi:MAG: hypothetical protein Kow0010_25900 [Dehalococcoidia bacterium]
MSAGPGRVYHLALRDAHASAGATFGIVEGWSLPLHYGSPAAEYLALREHAIVADRSHFSRFIVSGTDATDVLDAALTGHAGELEEGRAMRAVALDERGHIADLVLVARLGGIAYLVSGAASRRGDTLARLQAAVRPGFEVRVDDRTEATCALAIMGPAAAEVVASQLSESLPPRLPPMHAATFEFHGFRASAIRTSDTGEDGFEFMLAPAVARHLIEALGNSTTLAGQLALDTARVEACIPAFAPRPRARAHPGRGRPGRAPRHRGRRRGPHPIGGDYRRRRAPPGGHTAAAPPVLSRSRRRDPKLRALART